MLPITSLFAAAFTVPLVALSFPISLRRLKVGDMVGDSKESLRRRIRAQGNFIEYVPFGVLLLGLVKAQSGTATTGLLLAFGRILHANQATRQIQSTHQKMCPYGLGTASLHEATSSTGRPYSPPKGEAFALQYWN